MVFILIQRKLVSHAILLCNTLNDILSVFLVLSLSGQAAKWVFLPDEAKTRSIKCLRIFLKQTKCKVFQTLCRITLLLLLFFFFLFFLVLKF